MYGISLEGLTKLQGPLTSLDAAAHVLYRTGRAMAYSTNLAFATDRQQNDDAKAALKPEIDALATDYTALVSSCTIACILFLGMTRSCARCFCRLSVCTCNVNMHC